MAFNKNTIYVIIAIIVVVILYFVFRKHPVENRIRPLQGNSKLGEDDCSLIKIYYLANTPNKTFDANWTGSAYYTRCGGYDTMTGYGVTGADGSTEFSVKNNTTFQFGPMGTNSSPINIKVGDRDLSFLAYGSLGRCTGSCSDWPWGYMVNDGAGAIPCTGAQCHSFPVEADNKTPAFKYLYQSMKNRPWTYSTGCCDDQGSPF
jgi:hypothetical protein